MNRPTGNTDWKDAEPNTENQGQYNCAEVRCNFYRGGGTPDPLGYPPQAPLPSVTPVPRSMPCFRCIQRLDPFQFLPNFYYFYICQACTVLKMYYWVVLTADCRNSVCLPLLLLLTMMIMLQLYQYRSNYSLTQWFSAFFGPCPLSSMSPPWSPEPFDKKRRISHDSTPCLKKNCANLFFAPSLSNMNRFQ